MPLMSEPVKKRLQAYVKNGGLLVAMGSTAPVPGALATMPEPYGPAALDKGPGSARPAECETGARQSRRSPGWRRIILS